MAATFSGAIVINVVASSGERKSIKWFLGTPEDTVFACLSRAFAVPPDARISLLHKDGEHVAALDDVVEKSQQDAEFLLDVTFPLDELASASKRLSFLHHAQPAAKIAAGDAAEEERQPLLNPASGTSIIEVLDDLSDDEACRRTWLKFKRILAHLANERTYLAWLRVAAKAFTIALVSLALAAQGSSYHIFYAAIGTLYVLICPQIILLAARRYAHAHEAMMGSVHDIFESFRDRDLREVTTVLAALVGATLLLLVVAQLD